MNWLTNFVRPKIRALSARREPPDNLWFKCPNCGAMLFHRDLEQSLHVCPQCNFHMKIGAKERLQLLFDEGRYQLIELPRTVADPRVGSTSPISIRIVVVLPAPLRPRKPKIDPRGTFKSSGATTWRLP